MNVKRSWYWRRKAPSTKTAKTTTKKKNTTTSINNTNKWRSYLDKNSYKVYYYNIDTKQVTWHKPEELRGESDDEYSADDTASTTSIATVEEEDGISSSKVKGDDIATTTSNSKIDTNSTPYSAEKVREHMISSMIAMQHLMQQSTETITESSKVVISNIQKHVPSPPTLCAFDELDVDSDKKREMTTMALLGVEDDASFVSPTENTSNDVDNNVVDDSACVVLPSIFTCKLDDETAKDIVMSKPADEIIPSNNNTLETLESALHYDIQSSIIQKSLYNDIDKTESLLQSLSSDYRDTMDEYSYHAVVSKMNMIRREQKEQIQDSSIQNGKTLDFLLELVHTDDTISLSCDSSLDETDVSNEIEEVEEGEDDGLLNAVQVFAKYLQHGLVTEGSERYPYSSTV